MSNETNGVEYTKEGLEAKTVAELRKIAAQLSHPDKVEEQFKAAAGENFKKIKNGSKDFLVHLILAIKSGGLYEDPLVKIRAAIEKAGLTTSADIRALLQLQFKIGGKKATAILKELGVGGKRAGGSSIASDFYATLKSKPMSDEEFASWIAAGSSNTQKHKAHYDSIRQMANEIHTFYTGG